MKKIYIVFIILLLSLIIWCATDRIDNIVQRDYDVIKDVNPIRKIWGYEFSEKYQKENILFLTYHQDGEKIELTKVEDIEEETADKIVSDNLLLFESLFQLKEKGYPEQYIKYIECPDKFKPEYSEKEVDEGYLKYFIGFANSNYVAGACSTNLIKFKSVYGFLYCSSKKTLIELDYFIPLSQTSKMNEFLQRIGCDI